MRKAFTTLSVKRRALVALLAGALVLATALPALASAEEAEFITLINQSRSAQGLGPLSDFWDLTDDARVHTAEMIAAGQIYHSNNAQLSGYTTGWAKLGENVGMGPNPSLLHQAFMSSPGHRANILGDFDRVGVGTARSADGTLFVTVLFMQSSAPAPTTTTTTAPSTTTTTAPPATTTTAPPTTTTTTTTPTTTTTAPGPTSTTAPQPEADASPALITQMSHPSDGDRPATRVSNVRADRSVSEFRPVFSFLERPAADWPIRVYTTGGVSVTIE
ncbi:MAG TPA: CAP domain-containing protein [Candidatus Sulfomarinibacteraceae bacterium]|nr:CAP domain-containing protein [Candidatus Sulfomarinibacteraceae bacterium]